MNIDLYLFNLINGFAGKWPWLDYLGMFFAKYFEYFLWLALFLFLAFNTKKYWKIILEAFVAGGISRFLITSGIRLFWFRARPFVALNFIPLIEKSASEASFPSGHASFYFALSTTIYFYNKKIGTIFYVASSLIVLARIFVGVHWPSDILVGAILGITMGWVLNKLFKKYANKFIKVYN